MEEKILFISLALLFLTSGAPANAQTEAEAAVEEAAGAAELAGADGALVLYYDINRNLTLNCTLTSSDNTLSYVWKKNNETVDKVAALKNRHKLEQGGASLAVVGRASEDDWGQYSCALGAALQRWDVRGRPVARLPDNTNVVEGQKLKLQCRVLGRPYPRVSWSYNGSEPAANGSRVRLEPNEQGVPDAALVIDAAARGDAGVYECRAGDAADHTVLRVKDMYAALWPFLGICAEVFVLCAIILVYEKRRTKPEVEDSDTDNHDQKKS